MEKRNFNRLALAPLIVMLVTLGVLSSQLAREGQVSRGISICQDRLNLSVLSHTVGLYSSDYLSQGHLLGSEECWREVTDMAQKMASLSLGSNHEILLRSNGIGVKVFDLQQQLKDANAKRTGIINLWSDIREDSDFLKAYFEGSSIQFSKLIQNLCFLMASLILMFGLTGQFFDSWRRNKSIPLHHREIKDEPTPEHVTEKSIYGENTISDQKVLFPIEPKAEPAVIYVGNQESFLAPSLDVAQILSPNLSIAVPNQSDEMLSVEGHRKTPHEEEKLAPSLSETEINSETFGKELVEENSPREPEIKLMSSLLREMVEEFGANYFQYGLITKVEIIKDFNFSGNLESLSSAIFYLLKVHSPGLGQTQKQVHVSLRDTKGALCLGIVSTPVQNWDSGSKNLSLSQELFRDAGMELEWELNYLNGQPTLTTIARAPIEISNKKEIPEGGKLRHLGKGQKSEILKALRELE